MRIYENKYISVTSILGLKQPFNKKSFTDWCSRTGHDPEAILSTSQTLGEKVSEAMDNSQKGLDWLTAPPIDVLEANLLDSVKDFLSRYELISTEGVVKCKEFNYAGRYDGVIKDKESGKVFLSDWKTYGAWRNKEYKRVSSKIKKVREQLSLYAYAMEWEESLAVVVFKNDGTWDMEELKFDDKIIEWTKTHQDLILETIKNENSKRASKV